MTEFQQALEDAILKQQQEGLTCPNCGKTRVEHYYKKSKTCGSLGGFDTPGSSSIFSAIIDA